MRPLTIFEGNKNILSLFTKIKFHVRFQFLQKVLQECVLVHFIISEGAVEKNDIEIYFTGPVFWSGRYK